VKINHYSILNTISKGLFGQLKQCIGAWRWIGNLVWDNLHDIREDIEF
jgi:hypothetical protein